MQSYLLNCFAFRGILQIKRMALTHGWKRDRSKRTVLHEIPHPAGTRRSCAEAVILRGTGESAKAAANGRAEKGMTASGSQKTRPGTAAEYAGHR